ncbi:MAG: hypothetical protein WAK95_18660 [Desulfobacterales bacterium]
MVYVRGIIVPVKWDENGNVAGFGIETFDEDFYLIGGTSEVVRFKQLMREEVELGGDILMLAGKKTINVRDIRVFKLYS